MICLGFTKILNRYDMKSCNKALCLRFDWRVCQLPFVIQNNVLNRLSKICWRDVINNVNIIVFLKLCSLQCWKYVNYTLNKTKMSGDGSFLYLNKKSKTGKQNLNVYYVLMKNYHGKLANLICPIKVALGLWKPILQG